MDPIIFYLLIGLCAFGAYYINRLLKQLQAERLDKRIQYLYLTQRQYHQQGR